MEGYIGQVIMFAGTWIPAEWLPCNGQLLTINTNQALYSLIGTTYGGDGKTTFALPNLNGRVPIGVGLSNAPGATNHTLGQQSGAESVTLTTAQLPTHNHALSTPVTITLPAQPSSSNAADQPNPNGNIPAVTQSTGKGLNSYTAATNANGTLSGGGSTSVTLSGNTANTGNGTPTSVMNPCLGINFIICTVGLYPSKP